MLVGIVWNGYLAGRRTRQIKAMEGVDHVKRMIVTEPVVAPT
jgi:hypothetical protein